LEAQETLKIRELSKLLKGIELGRNYSQGNQSFSECLLRFHWKSWQKLNLVILKNLNWNIDKLRSPAEGNGHLDHEISVICLDDKLGLTSEEVYSHLVHNHELVSVEELIREVNTVLLGVETNCRGTTIFYSYPSFSSRSTQTEE